MKTLQYETIGGHIRTIKNATFVGRSENDTYSTWETDKGKIYHWFDRSFVYSMNRMVDDVITVQTRRDWAKPLGIDCHIKH